MGKQEEIFMGLEVAHKEEKPSKLGSKDSFLGYLDSGAYSLTVMVSLAMAPQVGSSTMDLTFME